ncbi:kinase-like domain-containing protein [Gigaspora rosea]|uniref:Kinase-like domain-containing protein n=1 Tax=Gigaspora rosea TaxID=44941 RepID=A0A397WAC8_9GLOM|nr:kinase-like domain-containing protein [Gigaspora rosea]
MKGIGLMIYGLTYNATPKEYLMVYQYANKGNLHEYLESNFREFNWANKLEQLIYISYDLSQIHEAGFIHGDIHSGNILLHLDYYYFQKKLCSYITDLGLSRRKNEQGSEKVFGVMPYVAPEIFKRLPFTSAADIYGFGAIMSEMSTGRIPFYDIPDEDLSVMKLNGSLPEFAPETPDCYVELAKKCMNSNPQQRPSAKQIALELFHLHRMVSEPPKTIEEYDIIKKFYNSDAINENSRVNLVKDSNIISISKINTNETEVIIHTSKILNTHETEAQDSQLLELTVPDGK